MYRHDMNISGAGKSRENFSSVLLALFLQMEPLKGDKRWCRIVRPSQEAVLVEILHLYLHNSPLQKFLMCTMKMIVPFSLVADMEAVDHVILEQSELPEIK